MVDQPRFAVHLTLTKTGDVVFWDTQGPTSAAYSWDVNTTNFVPVTAPSDVFCAGHSTLEDGRIVVVGGHAGGAAEVGIKDSNIYNPATKTWTHLPNMQYARWYPSTTTLPDGRVLAISGQITAGVWADTPEIYNPATNSWSTLSSINTSDMHDGGYPLTWVLPNGKIFVMGAAPGVIRTLDVNAQTWTNSGNLQFTFGSAAMYRPGKFLYSGGGPTWGGTAGKGAEVIDTTGGTAVQHSVQSMKYGRWQHNLVVLPDGKVLALGGSTIIDTASVSGTLPAEMFDPATETWTTMATEHDPRMYHSTALLLPDGRVLSTGGGAAAMVDYPTAEIYSPPYLFKGARPVIGNAPSYVDYSTPITIDTADAASISNVALIPLASVTHTLDWDQRYLDLAFTKNGNQLTATPPNSPNLAPPGYYMLFIINSNGVPGVAKVVKVGGSGAGDTTPPSVSMTAPAAGGVTGTIAVSANATDNASVAGVQFQVDGANIGQQDTTAPYSINWNSATVTNGNHTLRAIASDTSGNSATSAGVVVNVSNAGAPSNLVLALGFNEGSGSSASDSSGMNNSGTILGATWAATGKYGKALTFNGTSNWVTIPDAPSLDLTTGMTFEAWVNPSAINGWRSLMMKESGSTPIPRGAWSELFTYGMYANVDTNRPNFAINGASQGYEVRGTSQLPLNTWTHVASTYDGTTLRFFVNGTQVAFASAAGAMATSNDPLRIGGNSMWGEYFKGSIDEVRLYNRALSGSEITADMNAALP